MMRQYRSADPWSAFLTSTARGAAAPVGGGPSQAPPGRHPDHGDAPDEAALPESCRLVLARLRTAGGPQSPEQLHHATGLGLLEVADAVEALLEGGLVTVQREIDELIRATGTDAG